MPPCPVFRQDKWRHSGNDENQNSHKLLHLEPKIEIIEVHARVAELADALDLGSSVFGRAGSSPVSRNLS